MVPQCSRPSWCPCCLLPCLCLHLQAASFSPQAIQALSSSQGFLQTVYLLSPREGRCRVGMAVVGGRELRYQGQQLSVGIGPVGKCPGLLCFRGMSLRYFLYSSPDSPQQDGASVSHSGNDPSRPTVASLLFFPHPLHFLIPASGDQILKKPPIPKSAAQFCFQENINNTHILENQAGFFPLSSAGIS